MQKTPTHPTPKLFGQGRQKNKRYGIRLIPDNSNPLSLCWLLCFCPSGSILCLSLSCFVQPRWTSLHCILELPCPLASGWVKLLVGTSQNYCKQEIKGYQERKVTVVITSTSPPMTLSTVRATNASQFSQDCLSFSIESPTSWDSLRSQENQDS